MVAIPLLVRRQAGTTVTCSPKFVPSRNRTRGAAGGAGEGKGGCQRRRPRRAGTGTGHLWLAPPATESAHNQEFRQEAGIRSLIPIWSLRLPVHCSCRHWQWLRVLSHASSEALGATGSGAGSLPRSHGAPRAGLDDAGGRARTPRSPQRTLGTLREITLRAKRQIGTEGALERC